MVPVLMSIRTGCLTILLLLSASCASSQRPIDELWGEYEADVHRARALAEPDATTRATVHERADRARALAQEGGLENGQDFLHAAVLLVESERPADWALAAELGNAAAELGAPLGLRVAAEAIDKDLVAQSKPQRFGTQFTWDSTNQMWRLHPVDPTTTDEERAGMGVPPYADLLIAEIQMNARKSPVDESDPK